MFRPLNVLSVVGIAGLILGVARPVEAEQWQTFDCAKLLNETHFDEPGINRISQKDSYVRLKHPTPGAAPDGKDAVHANELFPLFSTEPRKPFLARSVNKLESGAADTLVCNLIVVEFIASDSVKLDLESTDNQPLGNRLPIVLVDQFLNDAEEKRWFESWNYADFNIPVKPEKFENGFTDLRADSFQVIKYFRNNVWNDNSVRFVSITNAPDDFKSILKDREASDANQVVVLCGQGDCTKIRTSFETVSTSMQIGPSLSTTVPGPSQAAAGGQLDDPGAISQVQTELEQPLETKSVQPLQTQVSVTVLDLKGKEQQENQEKIAKVGGIECILSGINSDLFETPPACPSDEFARLKEANALIRVTSEGHWQIVPRARFRDPTEIEVTPPKGQPIEGCSVDVRYTDKDGTEREVFLEPKDDPSDPENKGILFSAELYYAPFRNGNEVTFTLLPNDAASCGGGVERTASVQAEETVKLSLLDKTPLSRAVVHTFVLNSASLQDIGLAQDDVTKLGRSVLDAVESAHQRAASTRSDMSWALTSANVGVLNETGPIDALVSLSATQLREQVFDVFSGITETNGDLISSFSPAMSSERLKEALLPVVDRARTSGIDELTVTLIAPITSGSDLGRNDPCGDALYQTLPSDLMSDGGPTVQVAVFPLVRLGVEDRVNLTNLRPLSGGLYACRNTPVGLSVYPFYLEEWRPGVDVSSRYAAALSDYLADLIDALVSDTQVSK